MEQAPDVPTLLEAPVMWILTVTDEISGLKRVYAYRWKWLADLRSAFAAFPNLRRARYTRVDVARMPR